MKTGVASSYFGKYREIVLAVAFFLVFDLAVLILNFYISFQISADAVAINLAGRERMLSQRMTKALLTAQYDAQRGVSNVEALTELGQTVDLFDATLRGFENGGSVTGGDGNPVTLAAVTSTRARELVASAKAIWLPIKSNIAPLTAAGTATLEQIETVIPSAREHNLNLLKLMNSLTTELENTASAKANNLRTVQTAGIILALLNFAFILFKFISRLRVNDRKIEQAQNETTEILSTVKEGLFLLDADFKFGSQYSASLSAMLGRAIKPKDDFREILRAMVPAPVFDSACDYIKLLFGDRVRENLVLELNPLTAVEATVPSPDGGSVRRYLTLQFNRVMQDDKISHLLVTVFDVSAQVELEQALAETKKKSKMEIGVMLDLLKIEPAALNQFLNSTEQSLLDVNEQLRSVSGGMNDYRLMIASIFRQIHAIKGEAATLGLTIFEDLAQQFEILLADLRNKGAVSGDDLLSLPLPLDEFLERVTLVRDLLSRLASYHDAFASKESDVTLADDLTRLAQRIASEHGKTVRLEVQLELLETLPPPLRSEIKNIAVQLLRNAVVHGIESTHERVVREKPPVGSIQVALKPSSAGSYEFMLRDDGCGLIPDRIRCALIRSGRYTEAQLNELSDKQILMKIFEPGFTTLEHATRDAGHGVGMDMVKQKILQLGAHLHVATRQNMFTQFSIRFAV